MYKFSSALVAFGLLAATPAFAETTLGDSVKGAATKAKDAVESAAEKAAEATGKVIEKGKDAAEAVRDKAVETKKKIAGEPLIDINSADIATLSGLKGVGPLRAAAIIKDRPYSGKDDLVTRGVLPKSVYDEIKDEIVAKQP